MNDKKSNESLVSVIGSAIRKSLVEFSSRGSENSLSDIYMRFDAENTVIHIYDDMESHLKQVELENVLENTPDTFEKQIIAASKIVLQALNKEGLFDKEYVFKPFSVNLVDEDFIISEELLFIDNDTLKLDDSLLGDLDKELDDFLKDLMK